MPPDRKTPSGTSLISRSRTDSSSSSRNRATVSAGRAPFAGSVLPDGSSGRSQYLGDAHAAVLEAEQVAREQLVDAAEEGLALRDVPGGEQLGDSRLVGLGRNEAGREDRLDLGGEERADRGGRAQYSGLTPRRSRASSRRHRRLSQMAKANIPRRWSTHAVAPLFVPVDDRLGVRSGAVAVSDGLQLGPEVGVVVDLAVVADPHRPVLVAQRLLAGGQVDDAQPPVAEGCPVVEVEPLFVRPPVREDRRHPPSPVGVTRRQAACAYDARNATHFDMSFPRPHRISAGCAADAAAATCLLAAISR